MVDLERHGEAILRRALARGGDLAEIFIEERATTAIRFEDGKVERINSGTEIGAGLRLLTGDRTLYAHTNDVSLEGLLRAAETVASGSNDPAGSYDFQFTPERLAIEAKVPGHTVPTPRKTALVAELDRAIRASDPRIVQAAIVYADSSRRVAVVNSRGRFVEDVRPQTLLMVSAIAAQQGLIQTGYEAIGGTVGYELFDAEDAGAVALKAARQACLMLEADPAPTGRMPVVISSAAGGTMIHEAVGHGLEADFIEKNMSKYSGRLGETIAAPEVTVVDDGTLPGRRGSGNVDDEGTATQRTVLVEEGRLVRFMNDLKTARKMGHAPTGNGRRASYQHKPVPRMTNTLIAPGRTDPKEILAATERGLFVYKMGGGQVDPLNGDFVFDVREGYLIDRGRADIPVRGATLIGNGPEVLQSIELVGSDLGFSIGTCGKSGQGAPVSDAQPTLRIRELTVGGTAGAQS